MADSILNDSVDNAAQTSEASSNDEVNFSELFGDFLQESPEAQPLMNLISQVMALDDATLANDQLLTMLEGMISGAFTPEIMEAATQEVLQSFENEHYTRVDVENVVNTMVDSVNGIIRDLKPSRQKEDLLRTIFGQFISIFENARQRYHTHAINIKVKLDEGAQMPQYAHDSDSCADLYINQDAVVPAHSYGTCLHTGVHIQLPEQWQAKIYPRSSTGAKTPLRLSNSVGIIDPSYTGELLCFVDNVSDQDYEVKAGQRLFQLAIEPVYRCGTIQVDILEATERNDEGIGSTGA